MEKLSGRLLLAGVLFLSLLVGSAARAQWLIPPAGYAVAGAPFSATVRKAWTGLVDTQPGEQFYRIERDGAGRQRYEINLDGQLVATIYDPVAGRVISIHGTKATVKPMAVGKAFPADLDGPLPTCGIPPGWTAMDPERIAGQEACHDKQEDRELWRSRRYRMPLKSVTEDSRLGTVTQTVVEFVAGDPDARLFALPGNALLQGPPGDAKEASTSGLGVTPAVAATNADVADSTTKLSVKSVIRPPIMLKSPTPDVTKEEARAAQGGVGASVSAGRHGRVAV